MGKFKNAAFKWVSEFLMAMAIGFLFLAISISTSAVITGTEMSIMVASFVVFVLLTLASFVVRMLSV